jgi:hypothetical protein
MCGLLLDPGDWGGWRGGECAIVSSEGAILRVLRKSPIVEGLSDLGIEGCSESSVTNTFRQSCGKNEKCVETESHNCLTTYLAATDCPISWPFAPLMNFVSGNLNWLHPIFN